MTGTFELFTDNQYFRFRLTAPDGTVMALSQPFPDKATAVAGITAVREYAGMGLITDLCPHIPLRHSGNAQPAARTTPQPSPAARPASALPPRTAAGTSANPGRGTAGRDPRQHKAA